MKTILQFLKDEIAYPMPDGFLCNRLLMRGLDGEGEISAAILGSSELKGVVADCLYELVVSPDFSESDISVSIPDRSLILRKANAIYASIGEPEKVLDQPNVYIGR